MKKLGALICGLTLSLTSQVALAAPTYDHEIVPLTFTGVVTNDPGSTIRIQEIGGVTTPGQPTPTFPYTGPVPDYPLNTGDTIEISFNALVPSQAFLDSADYTGQIAADGIYTFDVVANRPGGDGNPAPLGTFAEYSDAAISSPFFETGSRIFTTGYQIIYDSNTGRYDLGFSGLTGVAGFDGPTFTYDYLTDMAGLTDSTCGPRFTCATSFARPSSGRYGFQIGENGGFSTGNVKSVDPSIAPVNGFFDILFDGSWSVTQPNPVQVPEPPMMLLFGAALLAIVGRRKMALRQKTA